MPLTNRGATDLQRLGENLLRFSIAPQSVQDCCVTIQRAGQDRRVISRAGEGHIVLRQPFRAGVIPGQLREMRGVVQRLQRWVQLRGAGIMRCRVRPAEFGLCDLAPAMGGAGGALDFQFLAFLDLGEKRIGQREIEPVHGLFRGAQTVRADLVGLPLQQGFQMGDLSLSRRQRRVRVGDLALQFLDPAVQDHRFGGIGGGQFRQQVGPHLAPDAQEIGDGQLTLGCGWQVDDFTALGLAPEPCHSAERGKNRRGNGQDSRQRPQGNRMLCQTRPDTVPHSPHPYTNPPYPTQLERAGKPPLSEEARKG